MTDERRILLIQPPLAPIHQPSCALGRLKASLSAEGMSCDCHYTNLDLHAYLDNELREWMGRKALGKLPDILYSSAVFPKHLSERRYLQTMRSVYRDPKKNQRKLFIKLRRSVLCFNNHLARRWEKRFPYAVVGVSANYNLMPALFCGYIVKKLYPSVQVIFGGSECIGEVGRALAKAFSFIDWVVDGEGEGVLSEIVRIVERGTHEAPAGTCRRVGKAVTINKALRKPIDLESLPFPDYDDYFNSPSLRRIKSQVEISSEIPVEASRGCWWRKCTFCNYVCYGHRSYERMSDDRVVAGMEHLAKRHRCLNFYFADSVQPNKLESLAKALIDSPYDYNFGMALRASISARHFELLSKAGLRRCFVGIESFSDELLEKMKKGVTALENIVMLQTAKSLGITADFTIISPYPGGARDDYALNRTTLSAISHLINGVVSQMPFNLKYGSRYFGYPAEGGIVAMSPANFYKMILPKRYRFKPTLYWDYAPRPTAKCVLPASIVNGEDGGALELYVGGKDYCRVKDRRTTSRKWFDYTLTPPHSDILVACLTPKKRNELACRDSALQDLIDLRLLIENGGAYLTLATRNR
ncbi:MAG: RiPP maturation radical SAM C-methyltransferase [Pseudomonadota bacterium]